MVEPRSAAIQDPVDSLVVQEGSRGDRCGRDDDEDGADPVNRVVQEEHAESEKQGRHVHEELGVFVQVFSLMK